VVLATDKGEVQAPSEEDRWELFLRELPDSSSESEMEVESNEVV